MASASKTAERNLLDYFKDLDDGLRLSWKQKVNSREALEIALAGSFAILEGDVFLHKVHAIRKVRPRSAIPMMGMKEDGPGDISLTEWLDQIAKHKEKGVMIYFHSKDVIIPALDIVKRKKIKGPVILRADVVSGYPESPEPITPYFFALQCEIRCPNSFLCVGWAADMTVLATMDFQFPESSITEMVDIIKHMRKVSTLPLLCSMHAEVARNSFTRYINMSEKVRRNTMFHIWTTTEYPIQGNTFLVLRKHYNRKRTYYSFPK